MIRLHGHYMSIMVLYCIVLHFYWALMIAIDADALDATTLAAIEAVLGSPIAIVVALLTVAVMATVGLYNTKSSWLTVWMLIPQQVMLLIAAAGCITAIWLSQYADGVDRPRAMISADQIPAVLAALGHSIAIIQHARAVRRM